MLDLGRPVLQVDSLTLFADASADGTFRFVSTLPSVARTDGGTLACLLIKYRLDTSRDWPRGGGVLHLETELSASPSALARAQAALLAREGGGNVALAPIEPSRVTCDAVLWTGSGPGSSIAAAPVAPASPHRASLQVALTMEAATLIEASLASDGGAIGVTYRLTVAARRPSLPARVQVDWGRAAQAVAAETGAGEPVGYAAVADRVAGLVQAGVVRLELQGDDPAIADDAMAEVTRLVGQRLFASGRFVGLKSDATPLVGIRAIERRALESQEYVLRATPAVGVEALDLSTPREGELALVATGTLGQLTSGAGASGSALVALMEELRHG